MAYLIGIHHTGTAQSLPFLESLEYIISEDPWSDGLGSGVPKNAAVTAHEPLRERQQHHCIRVGYGQAGPGDGHNELSPESAEQRDGPCASAGIPHGLSHHLGGGNKSIR